jgi:hypothetical protein
MKAGIHVNGNRGFVLLYSPWPDVMVQIPPSLRQYAQHSAHATYFLRGCKSISVYSVPSESLFHAEGINASRSMSYKPYSEAERRKCMKMYGINADILKNAPAETLDVIIRDVEVFAEGDKPKKKAIPEVEYVDKLVPKTKPRFASNLEIDAMGKQNYVPSCLIDINVDFFLKSCASLYVNGYYDPYGACVYCYAKGPQYDTPEKRIKRADKKNLVEQIIDARKIRAEEGKQTKFIRFGKVSESGSKFTRDQLLTALEACVEAEVRPIFPTKFLEYDSRVAELMIKAKGSLMFSIGADILEPGACANGCTNEFRLESAMHYFENKVNAGLYLMIDARNYENKLFSNNVQKGLKMNDETGIQVQLLPVRPCGRKQLTLITGHASDDMIGEPKARLFDIEPTPGGYTRVANNQYVATNIDSRFINLIAKQGISMCHHNKQTTWCGGCLHQCSLPKSFPTEHPTLSVMKRHKKKERIKQEENLFSLQNQNK